jgi:glutathione reductase (NADPH)
VTIHDARAEVEDPHTVRLSTGGSVTAEHILVATGGHPIKPDLPGAEHGLVSDDMFELEELPKRLLVVGGGYIACEFACMMRGMGVEVTIYHRSAQILRGFDGEARGLIAEGMRASGIDIHLGTSILEMDRREDGTIWTKSTAGIERICDAVLFATGRGASTKGLGLEGAGVEMHGNGAVKVDRFSRTSVPSIWAIGDVTDRIQLTPVAIREAMAFVGTVFQGRPTPADHDLVASAVFTHPEMGAVGMTEEEASESHSIEVYATSFRPMRTAFIERPARVLMKLVVEAGSRRVLGCHVVSPQAAEIVQLAAVAVKMGATKEDFDRTCAVRPTMSEEIVTMRRPVRTSQPSARDEGRMRTA